MDKLDFIDRISYLVWRKRWREAYKQLSQDIRKSKNDFKNDQRKVTIHKDSYGYHIPQIDGKSLYSSPTYYKNLHAVTINHAKAIEMMALLGAAKEKSSQQRAAMLEERGIMIS